VQPYRFRATHKSGDGLKNLPDAGRNQFVDVEVVRSRWRIEQLISGESVQQVVDEVRAMKRLL
jgi:hypothetical protein